MICRHFMILTLAASSCSIWANHLWYSGDFDGRSAFSNEVNTRVRSGVVYNNFMVDAPGWILRQAWSNNLTQISDVREAVVEVRARVTRGDGGDLLFSGVLPATQRPTGRSGFGYPEFEVRVDGLSLALTPGEFWLAVAPVGFGDGRSFITSTSGQNGLGRPLNDGRCFYNNPDEGYVFERTEDLEGAVYDYSMGVAGDVVPEPASVAALALGLQIVFGRRKPTR